MLIAIEAAQILNEEINLLNKEIKHEKEIDLLNGEINSLIHFAYRIFSEVVPLHDREKILQE